MLPSTSGLPLAASQLCARPRVASKAAACCAPSTSFCTQKPMGSAPLSSMQRMVDPPSGMLPPTPPIPVLPPIPPIPPVPLDVVDVDVDPVSPPPQAKKASAVETG